MLKKIVLGACALGLMAIALKSYVQIDTSIWNNGICSECGGHYEYIDTIPHSSYIQFKYECNKCNHTITTETDFR